MKKQLLSSIFILLFLSPVSSQETIHKRVKYPENYEANIDLIYTKVDHWEGRMDLYTNPTSDLPTPILINIHGGGWNHGSKEGNANFRAFFREGYAVANVEYRLVDIAPAPGAIEDIRCALIYIFKNAVKLNIDTNKIVIMGGSAGGHLALMSGLLGSNSIFDAHCEYNNKIKVAAIIDKYGPSDLTTPKLQKKGSVKKWLGKEHKNINFVESVSPLYYVNRDSPPVLIIHGTEDQVIPYKQSTLLLKKLKANNIKTELITIEGGGHGKFSKDTKKIIDKKMRVFLKELGLTRN